MICPNRAMIVFALTIALAVTGALLRSVQPGGDAQYEPAYVQIISLAKGDSSVLDSVRDAFDSAQKAQITNPVPIVYEGVRSAMNRALHLGNHRASLAR
jgi:hypothetical protein